MSGDYLKGLLEAAQRIQVEMVRVKAELANRTVSAETGGGLVQCTANGKGDVVALEVDPSLLTPDSQQMLQDLVLSAVNLALERARQMAQEEVVRATGGMQLPPGMFGG